MNSDDEDRLRELAIGLAKGVEDDDLLFARLGFSREDYDELASTRTFRSMLAQAASEWESAGNTHKRVKLKAAVNVEQSLPSFYQAMIDPKEPLSSRVKVLEVVTRVAGLANPELQPAGSGQYFKLEINLGRDRPPIVIENNVEEITHASKPVLPNGEVRHAGLPIQSKVWDGMKDPL